MHPFGITAEVLTVTKDNVGDKTESKVGDLHGCGFAPSTSTEDNDNRTQTSTTADLYCPALPFAVTSQHKIRLPGGDMWDVDGTPKRWDRPFSGGTAGVVIRLKQVRG
jgi:hypothetical protein